MKERTYAMLKPDGVKKGLLKEVIRRFEKVGLTVSHIKEMELDAGIVKQHYAHLVDKPFYPTLEAFMLSGPVVAMIVEGESAVSKVRELMGATDSKDALPGTIRGDYGDKTCCTYNIIHGSDSLENAEIEIDRFYPELQLKPYGAAELKVILNAVRLVKRFHITENGEIHSAMAEEYLKWLNQYAVYCSEDKQEAWKKDTHDIVYRPKVIKPICERDMKAQQTIANDDYGIIDDLYNFMDAGEIMKTYHETESWQKVYEVLKGQGHSGYTFSGVASIILEYAPFGVDFIDRCCPERINYDEEFKKVYMGRKKRNEHVESSGLEPSYELMLRPKK